MIQTLLNSEQIGLQGPFACNVTLGNGEIKSKDGKKMTVKTVPIHHHSLWKFWQSLQRVFITLLRLGTGLLWRGTLKNKWTQARTGKEKVTIYTLQEIGKIWKAEKDRLEKLKAEKELAEKLKAEQEASLKGKSC